MTAGPGTAPLAAGGEPVFLVGSERSGTTLLAHMLNQHPQIAWALALEFGGALFPASGAWPPLPAVHEQLRASWFVRRSGLHIDERLSYVALVADLLAQERLRQGKPLVGATVHRYFEHLPRLFPACRFIHLLRDPRDVSRSAVGLGFVGNVWRGAGWWADAETRWERLRAQLAPERRHEARYEQLIADPEQTLRGICTFIGVAYAPDMLRYPEHTRFAPADRSRIEPWRREAPAADVRVVEAVVGPLLQARGYAPSGLPPLHIGRLRRLWLREHDRYRRVRFRIASHGLGLTAADFCARRLGLRAWSRRLQRRIDDIEVRSLR